VEPSSRRGARERRRGRGVSGSGFAIRGARALGRWLVAERWSICLFVAALLVRLHWNAVAHPPGDYLYSDMHGYVTRADGVLREGWTAREYSGFYPWGTHALIAGLELVFGKKDYVAVGNAFAVMGAIVVLFGYLIARRVTKTSWVAPLVGLVLVFDYPLISLGGYFLSEIPFAVGMGAATWLLLRIIDEGRTRDAWLCGIAIAFALVMRPQILLSVVLVFAFWLVATRFAPAVRDQICGKLRMRHFVMAAVPIALVLAFSAVRLHHHTGRIGLISENGTFNQVFGRCHNVKIIALPDRPGRSRTSFGPPPLIQLQKRADRAPGEWPQLDPLIENNFYYHGYIGDSEILRDYMRQCIEIGGWTKQAEFALVHVLMLWRYNVIWPDSGKSQWQALAHRWGKIHTWTFAIPAVLAMFIVFVPRRHPKLAWVALHLWAAFAIAALYFGDVRLRTPYDPVLVLLALEGAAMLGGLTWARIQRNRGKDRGVEAVAPRSARVRDRRDEPAP
jgi:hypothetical protein